jgi:anti-sigma factor RsiW
MEITRNVILDLLPLYVADELSADTRALVEKYLETEPELAAIAEQTAAELAEDVPVPLTEEDRMEAYKEAKRLLYRRTLVWAAVIAVALMSLLGMAVMALMFLVRAW